MAENIVSSKLMGQMMGQKIKSLASLEVQRLTKPGLHFVGEVAGLALLVSATGARSWILRATIAGKRRDMGLGGFPDVTLADARRRARDLREQIDNGIDPIGQRREARAALMAATAKAMTFDQCAAAYIEVHRPSWKNAKHAAQWESTLNSYASPIFGALPVAAVDTALIVKALALIWQAKTETATRLRGRIESILDWATTSKFREGDNPARWRGHLENLLADPARSKRVVHHPALPWQEIGAFLAALRAQEGVGALAVQFAILTAARSGEVRLATWKEIDFDAALWVIPADRMKAGREHRIPLSSSALELLRVLPRTSDLIFPGARQGRPLSDMSLTAVLRRMGRDDITVHGFRSSFRDWCSECSNFPREVCEHALAHSLVDKVEAAYRRGDLIEKRALLMQAWANYCATIPGEANVLPMRASL